MVESKKLSNKFVKLNYNPYICNVYQAWYIIKLKLKPHIVDWKTHQKKM